MTVPERWRIGGAGSGGCEVRFWIASLALHANACIRTTRARDDDFGCLAGQAPGVTVFRARQNDDVARAIGGLRGRA